MLADKVFLITGGTGSFGNAAVNYLLGKEVREIRILSRDEAKQHHMRNALSDPRVKFYIGDVRDRASVDLAMKGADYVFHAAALKQVPSCEFFPMQAVMTNIIGSHNVAESAIENGIDRAVFLSTDKAVYPINAMGMSKALMEKTVKAAARSARRSRTKLMMVRYGNVMCSRGSVIPHFIQQIKDGKPITLTDALMTRFLLPLSDAITLVFHAIEFGLQGDIFIKKAPACRVQDIALALKEICRSDSPINEIGIRHGEKIHETLATFQELANAEDDGEFYRIRLDDRDLNYNNYLTVGEPDYHSQNDYTSENARMLTQQEAKDFLMSVEEVVSLLNDGKIITQRQGDSGIYKLA